MGESAVWYWGKLRISLNIAGNSGATLTHYFNKTFITIQSIIIKDHPHFLFTLACLNTFGSQNNEDLFLPRTFIQAVPLPGTTFPYLRFFLECKYDFPRGIPCPCRLGQRLAILSTVAFTLVFEGILLLFSVCVFPRALTSRS